MPPLCRPSKWPIGCDEANLNRPTARRKRCSKLVRLYGHMQIGMNEINCLSDWQIPISPSLNLWNYLSPSTDKPLFQCRPRYCLSKLRFDQIGEGNKQPSGQVVGKTAVHAAEDVWAPIEGEGA